MLLKNKVVIITGATKGIGRAIALKTAEEGAMVVASGIEPELIEGLEREFKKRRLDGIGVFCNVIQKEQVDNLMIEAIEKYGKIDAVVTCAGIVDAGNFEDLDEDRWDKLISINLKGVYLTDRAALPYLKKNGGGKIVNIGSGASVEAWPYLSSYAASKFGVRGLTQSLGRELGKYNITVNVVCPGIIDTGMWEELDSILCKLNGWEKGEAWKKEINNIPLGKGKGGKPEDVANVVVMLLSDYANYITGSTILVTGGVIVN